MRDSPRLLEQVKLHELEPEHIAKIGEIMNRIGVEDELLPEHTLSYLVDLWVMERQKGAQGDSQSIGELESLILSADAFQGGKPGQPGSKPFQATHSGQNPYFLPNKMLNDDKNVKVMAPQVAELVRLMDDGKISRLNFHGNFNMAKEVYQVLDSHPYGTRLQSSELFRFRKTGEEAAQPGSGKGLTTYLFVPPPSNDRSGPSAQFHWQDLAFWPGRMKDVMENQKSYALILPLLERKERTVTDKVTEKKWMRTVVTEVQRKEYYTEEKADKVLALSLISPRADNFGRRGSVWKMQMICKKEVADKIFSEVSKSPQALFNYFVETVPGFKEQEGSRFEVYQAAVNNAFERRGFSFKAFRYEHAADINSEFGSNL